MVRQSWRKDSMAKQYERRRMKKRSIQPNKMSTLKMSVLTYGSISLRCYAENQSIVGSCWIRAETKSLGIDYQVHALQISPYPT